MGAVIQYDFSRDASDSVDIAARKLKRSKTFERHAARLRGRRALTKNEIGALCAALNGRKAANLDADDRDELHALLNAREARPITVEQARFGIEWLRTRTFRLDGEPRRNCILGVREQEIVRNFRRFAWVGVYDTQPHYGNYNGCHSYVPVWRTYAADGSYFDYAVIAGGPGGAVDIVIL